MRSIALKKFFYFPHLFFSLCILLWGWSGLCASPKQMQDAYAKVAEKALPAVVTIYSLQNIGGSYKSQSVGSGFLISEDGFIVTNYHVISQADVLAVKLASGKVLRAETTGTSKGTDLAVLKINGKPNFPFLTFADTRNVKVGHYAIAIGSPFSLSQTVTVGIVSHKGRELGLHYKEDYIQTDASINPGNSGGPLLNIDGDVIGVNDCIISAGANVDRRSNTGIGFAIDGNLANRIVTRIIRIAKEGIPFAGFIMQDDEKTNCPIVVRVISGSPAESSGLKEGDHIVKIDSTVVSTIQEAQATILSKYLPGNKAIFEIRRNSKLLNIIIQFQRRK